MSFQLLTYTNTTSYMYNLGPPSSVGPRLSHLLSPLDPALLVRRREWLAAAVVEGGGEGGGGRWSQGRRGRAGVSYGASAMGHYAGNKRSLCSCLFGLL